MAFNSFLILLISFACVKVIMTAAWNRLRLNTRVVHVLSFSLRDREITRCIIMAVRDKSVT